MVFFCNHPEPISISLHDRFSNLNNSIIIEVVHSFARGERGKVRIASREYKHLFIFFYHLLIFFPFFRSLLRLIKSVCNRVVRNWIRAQSGPCAIGLVRNRIRVKSGPCAVESVS